MIGRRRPVLPGGVAMVQEEPPPWRLLTVADLGTPVLPASGDQAITVSDSGDPLYPLRCAFGSSANAVGTVCIPFTGDAAAILDRAVIAAPIMRVRSTVDPAFINFSGVGFGSFDGSDAATPVAAGVFVQKQSGVVRFGRWAVSNTTLNTTGGHIDIADADPDKSIHCYVHVLDSPDAATTKRIVWCAIAGPEQDGTAVNTQTGAGFTIPNTLASGSPTWCLALRKGTSSTVQTIDVALWIMATPPGAPFFPQP